MHLAPETPTGTTSGTTTVMPAEWDPHERTWMAFPPPNDTFGPAGSATLARARHAWAAVARTIARHEPVTVVAAPADADAARAALGERIDVVEAPLDDAWLRDSGPTFAHGPAGDVVAVDWVFNGWGAQEWASWGHDQHLGRFVAERAGASVRPSSLVNEGGGFHVDGEGTVLLTETVQLDPGRNPEATKEQVEAEIHARLGTTRAIWLPRGLSRDYDEFGTRGHVDIVAAFAGPGTVLVHHQDDPAHPDFEVSRQIRAVLESATDARGRRLRVVDVPAPTVLDTGDGFVDFSYLNHYVANGVVVLCAFDDPHDAVAAGILAEAYPGRTVELVDARDIFAFGGGIHCITQQQPAARRAATEGGPPVNAFCNGLDSKPGSRPSTVAGSGSGNGFDVVEASIGQLRAALESGRTTSEELVTAYLARVEAYDRGGPRLNAVVVDNPAALEEARASDARRARGETLGPLDGIPYTAKDSYQVRGLTVAAGSPAFEHLVAQDDAFTVERLRAGGAVLIGLTNMPPMANGGMQRGVYGRAESPYSAEHLTAAFGSGSSNGSGTATAASFAAFGLGEETWSSGRAPASNNALCAYTPSRGVISVRGNWPLVPTMDVVVPHTRTMADLLEVLDVVVADDPETRGDFWRVQPWIGIPAASAARPASYPALAVPSPKAAAGVLAGARLGVPRMYVNADPEAGTAENPGIGGPTGRRIETRASVIALWEAAHGDLEAAGAEVVEVDFPAVTNYEGDRPGAPTIATRGFVSPEYLRREVVDLSAWAWHDFLAANGDPALHRLADVDGSLVFPHPAGALPDRYDGFDDDIADYPDFVREHGVPVLTEIPCLEEGLRGLEETRRIDLERWMDELGLDAVVFPAVADVGPADADVNPASADLAWRNGVWVANGNLVPRHLGIPTVTVPMGTMADTGMPVGLTIAGRAWDDTALLRFAAAFEATGKRRTVPPRTPPLNR